MSGDWTGVHRVLIDGVETVLHFDSRSGSRGWQYLTPDASRSHAFPKQLEAGQVWQHNGHRYEVLS